MSFAIPDPRWEAPELFNPQAHPLGLVKVDWDHPLAVGLQHAIVFNQRMPKDLVTGRWLTPVNGVVMEGRGHYLSTSADSYYTLDDVTLYKNVTMAARIRAFDNAGSTSRYLAGHGVINAADTFNWYLNRVSQATNPNRQAMATGATSRTATIDWWPQDSMYLDAVVTNNGGAGGGAFWQNGLRTTVAGTNNTAWTASSQTRTLYVGSREDAETTRILDATMFYLFIWNRYWTDFDARRFNSNPYQFLIPV